MHTHIHMYTTHKHTHIRTTQQTTLLDTHNEELKRLEQLTRDKADQQLVEVVTKLENEHTQQQEALREAHTHEMNVCEQRKRDMFTNDALFPRPCCHNSQIQLNYRTG